MSTDFNKFLTWYLNYSNFNKFLMHSFSKVNFYDFKCGWFDHEAYFEFFPLHVVYKLRDRAKKDDPTQIKHKLIDSCLKIPELIASAHSRRFDKGDESKIMDDCLEECNKTMVYLEQVRDIFGERLDRVVCDDLLKRYIYARRKIRNLQKAWQGFRAADSGKNAKLGEVTLKYNRE